MANNGIRLVAFDLDGTVLPSGGDFGARDLESLEKLGRRGVLRVMATGRSLFSLKKVVPEDFPVDYVLFSSGAGILNWNTGVISDSSYLKEEDIKRLFQLFSESDLDFMIHMPVPENHNFIYYLSGNRRNQDFERRTSVYSGYSSRIVCKSSLPLKATQFLAVFPPEEFENFLEVKEECKGLSVIRATSPLDGKSIWMEVFPEEVSKGRKLKVLCNRLDIGQKETLGVGNDYNDIDMLEWVGTPFVVANAPDELRNLFQTTGLAENSGFSEVVSKIVLK